MSYHDLAFAASGESKFLADVTSVAAASKLLLRLHGAFMLAAWLGAASVGILLARYYRQTWVGSTLCGKDQWFAVCTLCSKIFLTRSDKVVATAANILLFTYGLEQRLIHMIFL